MLADPPDPVVPLARIVSDEGEVMVEYTGTAAGTRGFLLHDADLSGVSQ